jgi:hypothetical protein
MKDTRYAERPSNQSLKSTKLSAAFVESVVRVSLGSEYWTSRNHIGRN